MHKLGIIIPYRNRYDHLQKFKASIIDYIGKTDISYELIVVEQDDAKEFNRGKLLNIGFIYAKRLGCDYVVFHDVDMLPKEVDYSYTIVPTHLATNFVSKDRHFNRIVFDEYFGGVTIFPIKFFERINGYSNDYWGWGYEDDDLLYRCKIYNIPLDIKEIPIVGANTASLRFNGTNSYVTGKNIFNIKNDLSIYTSFFPDDIVCDHSKLSDVFTIFSIPGYDFRLSYNAYRRYSLEIFDSRKNVISISSDIKSNYKTNIIVTINQVTKTIRMYQDGLLIGYESFDGSLFNYNSEKKFFLGCANIDVSNKQDESYFKGLINSFAVYNKVLSSSEIKELSANNYFGLTQNFGEYISSDSLMTYYDAKFIKGYKLIDLSGNSNDGEIQNCEITGYYTDETKIIQIPFRKECVFELLPHTENGFVNNSWKSITTRYNQLKFHNEVQIGIRNIKNDGLSNCEFVEHSNIKNKNQTHIVVGI